MDITEKPMGKLKDGAKRFSQNAVQIDNGQQSQGMFLLILMAATGLQEHPSLPPRALSLSPLKLGSFSKFLAFGCSSHLSPRLLWGGGGTAQETLETTSTFAWVLSLSQASLVTQTVKSMPTMKQTRV